METNRVHGRPSTSRVPDLLCFSHRPWGPDFARAQQLLGRFAQERRVFFVEPARVAALSTPRMHVDLTPEGVWVARPRLPEGPGPQSLLALEGELIDGMLTDWRLHRAVHLYYTPLALPFTRHLRPRSVIYDCAEVLPTPAGPTALRLEAELLSRADLVLAASAPLHLALRERHPNVHPVPDGEPDAWERSWARAHLLLERALPARSPASTETPAVGAWVG